MQNVNEPGSIWSRCQTSLPRRALGCAQGTQAHRYAARAAAGNVDAWHFARLLLAHLERASAAWAAARCASVQPRRLKAHLVCVRPASGESAGAVVCAETPGNSATRNHAARRRRSTPDWPCSVGSSTASTSWSTTAGRARIATSRRRCAHGLPSLARLASARKCQGPHTRSDAACAFVSSSCLNQSFNSQATRAP